MSVDRQPPRIRVLVIAGIRLYCEGLAELLSRRASIDVVGMAGDPVQGLQRDRDLQPDVVLVDTSMPRDITTVRAILATVPAAKVIALGVSEEDQDVFAFAEAGVCGYVTREATLGHLAVVIESVARGELPCPPRLAAMPLRHIRVLAARRSARPTGPHLTHRELEVVDLIDLGLSNKEIARRLCIEVPTVKNHVHRILDKLQLARRAEAAAWVRANEGQSLVRLRADRSRV